MYQSTISRKWTMVPWDYDLTYGRSHDSGLPFPESVVNDNFQYFSTPSLGAASPLKEKFLQNNQLYDLLKKRLAHIMGISKDEFATDQSFGWFSPANFGHRVISIHEAISKDQMNDVFNSYTLAQLEEYIEAMQYYGIARYYYIKKLVLDKTVHGTSRWTPAMNKLSETELLAAAHAQGVKKMRPINMYGTEQVAQSETTLYFTDEYTPYVLGTINAKKGGAGTQVTVEVQSEKAPGLVPPKFYPASCIQRTWFVTIKSPYDNMTADIRFEYIQEHSFHNELGDAVDNEHLLRLFQQTGENWYPLETTVNTIANTVSAMDVDLKAGTLNRFVACEDATSTSSNQTGSSSSVWDIMNIR